MSYPSDDEVIDIDEIDGDPWDKHQDESSKNYKAFCAYRDLGPDRTKLQAYLNYSGKSREAWGKNQAPSQFYAWSKRYAWNDRVEAWDEQQEEKRRERYEEEMMDYAEDMINNAQTTTSAILEAINHRLEGKSGKKKAELIFEDDSMNLESVVRTLVQVNSLAEKTFGKFTKDEDESDGKGILEEIEEAVKDD